MTRLMRAGLAHEWRWSGDDAAFFAQIDDTGGWPVGYKFVGFEHTAERAAGFTNSPHNDGWWTIVASADDYYLWKLSPEALQRIADSAIRAATITQVDASKAWFKNYRGHRAAIAAPTKQEDQSCK